MRRPALLGGVPLFPDGLAFARPFTPPLKRVTARLAASYDRGILTDGPLVANLEREAAERLNVPHAVAVSSCTAGLMLVFRCLGIKGSVVLPSFTFTASALSAVWAGLRPVFAECDRSTFQIDLADSQERLARADAVLATHVFGAPAPAEELESFGQAAGLPVVFDAAHAFGARHNGRAVGSFGDAEVFSLSPTKLVTAGEGGVITTRHADLAQALRIGRNYGKADNYDVSFVGLSARMSEFHAAVALESLALLDDHLARRAALVERYRAGLRDVPGLSVQQVSPSDVSAYKDFTLFVDADVFGMTRDTLVAALTAEGIDTRSYFAPPVHRQTAFARFDPDHLPVTDEVSAGVLSLPLFGRLPFDAVDSVIEALYTLPRHADELRQTTAA